MNYDISTKIYIDFDTFEARLQEWRDAGEKIVFTNGCFDIIHHGHVDSLLKSASFGTRLIVGLNSDESVRRLKGEGHPVLDVNARSKMMASIIFVDAVVIFEEDTPAHLISRILPDVLVKGKEYALEEIAGHDVVLEHGGKVERLDLVPGISTSEMIKRLKMLD